jgi:hypothetical protein
MQMILETPRQVNSPTSDTAWTDTVLSVEHALSVAGFYPVADRGGFACFIPATGTRFRVELPRPLAAPAVDAYDVATSDDETTGMEDLSDAQLRNIEFAAWVELQDRAHRGPVTMQSAPMPDDEFDAFWVSGPGSVPQEHADIPADRDYMIEVTDEDMADVFGR